MSYWPVCVPVCADMSVDMGVHIGTIIGGASAEPELLQDSFELYHTTLSCLGISNIEANCTGFGWHRRDTVATLIAEHLDAYLLESPYKNVGFYLPRFWACLCQGYEKRKLAHARIC